MHASLGYTKEREISLALLKKNEGIKKKLGLKVNIFVHNKNIKQPIVKPDCYSYSLSLIHI